MTAIYAFSVPFMNSNTNSTNYFAIAKKNFHSKATNIRSNRFYE